MRVALFCSDSVSRAGRDGGVLRPGTATVPGWLPLRGLECRDLLGQRALRVVDADQKNEHGDPHRREGCKYPGHAVLLSISSRSASTSERMYSTASCRRNSTVNSSRYAAVDTHSVVAIFGSSPDFSPPISTGEGCWVRHHRMAKYTRGTSTNPTMPTTAASVERRSGESM